jgi:hypothetical protein
MHHLIPFHSHLTYTHLLLSNNSYSCIFHSDKYMWLQIQMCTETWTHLYIKWLLKSPLDLNQNWRGSTRFHKIRSVFFELFLGYKQGEAAIQTGDPTGLQISKHISEASGEICAVEGKNHHFPPCIQVVVALIDCFSHLLHLSGVILLVHSN